MTLPSTGDVTWGTTLNAHINVEHDTDGTHKATEVTAVVTGEGIFGTWTNLDSLGAALAIDETYKVGSDGFVSVIATDIDDADEIKIYSDSVNGATTLRAQHEQEGSNKKASWMVPVKKDDYFGVEDVVGTPTVTIYWLPIGSGTCVKQ